MDKIKAILAAIVAWVKAWFGNVVSDAVSSKKFLVTLVVILAVYKVNQKYALVAFLAWLACQTAVDIVKIYKEKK